MYFENIHKNFKNKINFKDGKKFLKDKKHYSSFKTGENYIFKESIIESMENGEEIDLTEVCDETSEMYNLEICFQRTLQKYNSIYNLISNDILLENEIKTVNKDILNSIIEYDGNYYYVNNFGYTHRYNTSLEDNDETCPNEIKQFSGDFEDLLEGPDMNQGQPCEIAGKIVQNIETGEHAWVDITGKKHIFTSDIWQLKDETCNKSIVLLDNDKYDSLPVGANMESTDSCDYFKINPTNLKMLGELNDQLMNLSIKLINEIDNTASSNQEVQTLLDEKKQNLLKQYETSLKHKNTLYSQHVNRFNSMNANETDSSYLVNSSFYQYWLWLFIAIIVVYFAVQNFYTSNNQEVNTSTLLVVIILLLFAMILMYKRIKKFFN